MDSIDFSKEKAKNGAPYVGNRAVRSATLEPLAPVDQMESSGRGRKCKEMLLSCIYSIQL